jgi:phosphate transport system substrate-binding protein
MLVRILSVCLSLNFVLPVYAADIHGAGATFPALVYQKWATYYSVNKGSNVDYLAVGSGEGIKRIKAGEVDFGGTDMPLQLEELNKNQLIQFPMVMGAITPVINIPGVLIAQLKLDGKTLASIFMGKIRIWNDPQLIALNPNLHLPALTISVIHREDKSGTTFNFTNYLSKISNEWREQLGEGLVVQWPVGIAAKGNAGVAEKVKAINGSIGYVDIADAWQHQLNYVLMKNKNGNFVRPNAGSTQAAAAGAQWDADNGFYQILTDAPGETSWPIAATTFILVRKNSNEVAHMKKIFTFIDFNYRTGELNAMYFDFVMMPRNLIDQIRASWKTIKDVSGKSAWD